MVQPQPNLAVLAYKLGLSGTAGNASSADQDRGTEARTGGLPEESAPSAPWPHKRSVDCETAPRAEVAELDLSKNCVHFSICACHPCAGAVLIFSGSFQF